MAATMSNSTSISEEASVLSPPFTPMFPNHQQQQQPQPKDKKKRSQPGNPDPDAEVIALSPKTLMTTNRYVCEICNKGFQRDQNLQLHRRGHNLPWKLRGKSSKEAVRKRVYVCPEESCVHHHSSRALGDLTGIKKHYFRKHGEKKWRCERCSKRYAVHSDWKAHVKTCGTREYRCDCGTLFSRKDSFITHRAFCDALAEETARLSAAAAAASHHHPFLSSWDPSLQFHEPSSSALSLPYLMGPTSPHLSATALLQKAAAVGPIPASGGDGGCDVGCSDLATWPVAPLTRDFLGMEGELQSLGADRSGEVAGFRLPTVTGTWGP